MNRLKSLLLVTLVCSMGILATANAQEYPDRTVRLVDPYSPGGSTTVVSRALSQKFTELAGQSMIVDHRPGAGSNIGSDLVAKAEPDGYTLLLGTSSLAINPSLYSRMPFDPIKHLSAITTLVSTPNVLAVHPSVPVNSVKELIEYARKHPGKLNYGSSGNGATNHMAMELFKRMAGIDIVHIPFKGGADALAGLLGGQIQVMFNPASTLAPQDKAGRLKMLAIGSTERTRGVDLPTISESGLPGFESRVWFGLFAPAGTPEPVIARLNTLINAALKDEQVAATLEKSGLAPVGGSAQQLASLLAEDTKRWAEVVKASGARID